ncbi:UbiH/UbiF/VisC/COQ6 family ubiquinone biosynthesis hydroxylase [Kangiella koreensis]|uniref:Ubiquinone biosynthesis hydroxylase, UbiH/UbiF/VisC/COQ6 family n=1 Tax=Kangiella koreensis (strain DSM 16069 / JCM 12317 / KCTC 12182 / SW-125) TaxID=523791 RepID=C7R982_KANKD|nr:UbiH/UbiF/VisC/COQ6 family ubiquinone biosynthesis hydroxylase [Kangiella koreensis]ACV27872.1 Ubiquinone biosynthesis hydroxylase, UbiH/UbiF/VisC/COQ6 family [Kangiella koreensis DSM 16069]
MQHSNPDYDLIIVGGGMVGLALAARLAQSQLKIAIIDPKPVVMSWDSKEFDLRVSAITRASQKLLDETGAWDFIDQNEKTAYQKMSVWDGEASRGKIEFDANLLAEPNLGHIIENRVLRRSLFQAIKPYRNIDFISPQKCNRVTYQAEQANIELADSKTISAKLLVAADGAMSWLRKNSGIDIKNKPYGHKAIVATIKTEDPHQYTAWQRFDHNGPLAFLPLTDKHHCSIVWSVKSNYVDQLMALKDKEFLQRLEQTFEFTLGQCLETSQRVAFPLIERTAESLVQDRIALVGDAAHTIHPLAGQGVNLGLSDVIELAETIERSHGKQQDIGLKRNLRPYERARKGDIFMMQKAMQGFKLLFEQEMPLIQMTRSYGLALTNQHPLLKQHLIKHAMGL